MGGQRHAPASLSPGKTRYPLYRRLGGPQGRPGRVRKIWPPTGTGSLDRTAVANRYTDWAIPAHFLCVHLNWLRYCLLHANTTSLFHHTHRSSKMDPLLSQFNLIHVLDPIFLRHWPNINPAQVCLQTSRFSSGQQPTWLHVFFISQIRATFSANLTLTALMQMFCTFEHGRWERTGTHSGTLVQNFNKLYVSVQSLIQRPWVRAY